MTRKQILEERLRRTQKELNDALAVVSHKKWHLHGPAFAALADNLKVLPDLPITAPFVRDHFNKYLPAAAAALRRD